MRKGFLFLVFLSSLLLIVGCVEITVQPDGSVEYKEYLEEIFEPSDSFVLDNFMGKVLIEPATDGKIKVQAVKVLRGVSEERLAEVVDKITVEMDHNLTQTFIKTEQPRTRPDGVRSMWVDFRIFLPPNTTVNIRSSNGSIMVNGLRENLNLRTSNASIIIKDHFGDIIGRSSNGDIHLDECSGYLDLHTSNAKILLTDITGSIKATSSNGGIIIDTENLIKGSNLTTSNASIQFKGKMIQGQHYEMKTSNGSIQVWIDITLGYDLTARTSNGKVKFDFPMEISGSYDSKYLNGQVNGGGTVLILNTSNSSITLHEMEGN